MCRGRHAFSRCQNQLHAGMRTARICGCAVDVQLHCLPHSLLPAHCTCAQKRWCDGKDDLFEVLKKTVGQGPGGSPARRAHSGSGPCRTFATAMRPASCCYCWAPLSEVSVLYCPQVRNEDFVARPTPVNTDDYGNRLLLLPGERVGRRCCAQQPASVMFRAIERRLHWHIAGAGTEILHPGCIALHGIQAPSTPPQNARNLRPAAPPRRQPTAVQVQPRPGAQRGHHAGGRVLRGELSPPRAVMCIGVRLGSARRGHG